RNGEDARLLGGDHGVTVPEVIDEGSRREVLDARGKVFGHDRGLVGRRHRLEMLLDLLAHCEELGVPSGRGLDEALAALAQEMIQLAPRVLELESALDDRPSEPD